MTSGTLPGSTSRPAPSAVLDERGQVCELKAKVACLESFRHENNMTIMELKAKLYDLMVEKEG